MEMIKALGRFDGVARIEALRHLGVTTHQLRGARERGLIFSVRRGWVALRGADPMLVAAARRGVVLSCITLAARRGLWVLDASEPHVAAPSHAGHVSVSKGVIHWSRPLFPRDPDSCEDSLENALVLAARCQPYVWLLGHRVDFLIGERLVVQIDGGHHVDAQRSSDIAHDALLKLHGYHVIRISYPQLMQQWHEVHALIIAAIAQRLHLAT